MTLIRRAIGIKDGDNIRFFNNLVVTVDLSDKLQDKKASKNRALIKCPIFCPIYIFNIMQNFEPTIKKLQVNLVNPPYLFNIMQFLGKIHLHLTSIPSQNLKKLPSNLFWVLGKNMANQSIKMMVRPSKTIQVGGRYMPKQSKKG